MSLYVDIQKSYKAFCLTVSFSINSGEIVGLFGESGSGKSMTLRSIAGITQPDCGRIVLKNHVLFDSHEKINLPAQKRHTGYLFQSYALFPHLTVFQNIACGIKNKNQRQQIIEKMTHLLQITDLLHRFPHELSGGQKQRIALARLLASEPAVILLDEPFSALDNELKDSFQNDLLQVLSDFACPVIFVSHNKTEIEHYCTRTMVITKGTIL